MHYLGVRVRVTIEVEVYLVKAGCFISQIDDLSRIVQSVVKAM